MTDALDFAAAFVVLLFLIVTGPLWVPFWLAYRLGQSRRWWR